MALFHLHDGLAAPAGKSRFAMARARARLAATLKAIHEAIVAARTRRLQRELMFHTDPGDQVQDATRCPQHPMILGDKWDF